MADDFSFKDILKSPVGILIIGILLSIWGITLAPTDGGGGLLVGLVITLIGIIWLVRRKKQTNKIIDANLPHYLEIVNTLKNGGYEVKEFEHKSDRIRSSVCLNGNTLGEIFLVTPGPGYEQLRRVEEMIQKGFARKNSRNIETHSEIPASYWPDDSLIGAWLEESSANYLEKEKWLSYFATIFEEKS